VEVGRERILSTDLLGVRVRDAGVTAPLERSREIVRRAFEPGSRISTSRTTAPNGSRCTFSILLLAIDDAQPIAVGRTRPAR
jgi:hypothetical protein